MSAHGFKSVFTVGAIAGTALACYLVSLHVASERAALEAVENKIVLAQRDIRLLNTEIGTRGRLAQLERWNVKVIRLSAPSADQFVENSFQLATLAKPEPRRVIEAPVVFAAAPAPARREPVVTNDGGSAPAAVPSRPVAEMMHVAGYAKPEPKPARFAIRPEPKPLATAPGAAKAKQPATAPAAAKPKSAAAVKSVKTATADPLGPLSAPPRKAKSDSATAPRDSRPAKSPQATKDSGSRQ